MLSCHKLLPCPASVGTRLGLLTSPVYLVRRHGTGGLYRLWLVEGSAFGSLRRVEPSQSYRLRSIHMVIYGVRG